MTAEERITNALVLIAALIAEHPNDTSYAVLGRRGRCIPCGEWWPCNEVSGYEAIRDELVGTEQEARVG